MNQESTGETRSDNSSSNNTSGVKTLLGDPKKAIVKLSLPMIVAMSAHTIYNLTDTVWVSGLGTNALAAVGFVLPFFLIALSISTGLGVGSGSAISRRIGSKDKKGADNVAVHTIIMMALIAIIYTIPFFIFAREIFFIMGAGEVIDLATSYGRIIFGGSILIFFTNVANAILRGEGDARRAMYAMLLGAGLNVILDPFFIYEEIRIFSFNINSLGLGVQGAAWATLLSMGITSIILLYWLFSKKDTYVSFIFRGFKFNKSVIRDILKVGFPASIQQLSMAFTMMIINVIIVNAINTSGVAVYRVGWSIAMVAILPLLGIATAVVSVTGAAYGARDVVKLNTAFMYSIKLGFIIMVFMGLGTFLFAPWITAVFTTAEKTIASDLETFLRIVCLFYPGTAFGMLSSAMFQGTGKGINSLIVTLLRTVVLTTTFTIMFIYIFDFGLEGVWWGIVGANLIGSVVAFSWGKMFIIRLRTRSFLK